ncbi:hypothetical protein Lal_00026544 [Lupinus albus]|uniref:Putative transcription factor C2C2-CO-like family n=1 Tax=Lupinus albus TaxID=3870 RepID=A0A6A4Q1Q1_LUPAL|nr:putative transcription factor C2C2-CO-like family [Lupinus albus]KAF1862027.1 hypothetical protein Lal_00026544 [Lupinus albus]
MIRDMKAASALAAKTARACHSCLRRRARWFCAADDAFLCHGCDSLVHSANQLANRHERVKLQTASNKVATKAQAWHSGFTRKARTPRNNKHLVLQQRLKDKVLFNNSSTNILPIVPELGGEEEQVFDDEESEEQMLCRVPVFEPFNSADFCNIYNDEVSIKNDAANDETACDLDSFSEFLASDMNLADFAADVESLLGTSEVFDCKEEDEMDGVRVKGAMVKVKDEELDEDTACHLDSVFDMTNEAFDWNIDSVLSTAPAATLEEEEKVVVSVAVPAIKVETKRDINLRLKLNYEEVIATWASQGCPWTTGNPPKFNSDDCWLDFLGSSSGGDAQCSSYGEVRRSLRGHHVDGEREAREARVSRYREKRRTRLFSKKIRYEVRKLNAEKRPRMKGRFVKRACFFGGANNAFEPYH